MARGESLDDTAMVLGRYAYVVGREGDHVDQARLSESATGPVVNPLERVSSVPSCLRCVNVLQNAVDADLK